MKDLYIYIKKTTTSEFKSLSLRKKVYFPSQIPYYCIMKKVQIKYIYISHKLSKTVNQRKNTSVNIKTTFSQDLIIAFNFYFGHFHVIIPFKYGKSKLLMYVDLFV